MTKKKSSRVPVSFGKATQNVLSHLACQEGKSVTEIIRELTLEALEMREDVTLSKVAEKLDKEHVKTYGHEDAWQATIRFKPPSG